MIAANRRGERVEVEPASAADFFTVTLMEWAGENPERLSRALMFKAAFDGCTLNQIAIAFGSARSTVRGKIEKTRVELREYVRPAA